MDKKEKIVVETTEQGKVEKTPEEPKIDLEQKINEAVDKKVDEKIRKFLQEAPSLTENKIINKDKLKQIILKKVKY